MKQSQRILVGIIVLVLLGGGGYLFMKGSTPSESAPLLEVSRTPTTGAMVEQKLSTTGSSDATTPAAEGTVKTFTVTASNFAFDVKEMKVKKGDTVSVTVKNEEGFHDWKLDEFNATTQKLKAGSEETVTFTADKTGTFEYYCSVGSHRAMGMVGKLIVE
jgi:cytochrome c oxidase subunit II